METNHLEKEKDFRSDLMKMIYCNSKKTDQTQLNNDPYRNFIVIYDRWTDYALTFSSLPAHTSFMMHWLFRVVMA